LTAENGEYNEESERAVVTTPRSSRDPSAADPIGFPINFFSVTRTALFVNNNGNVTLDAPLSAFTPFGLAQRDRHEGVSHLAVAQVRDHRVAGKSRKYVTEKM
jgi:hypothetical protein